MRTERERYNTAPANLDNLIHDALMYDEMTLGTLCRTIKVSARFVEKAMSRMRSSGELREVIRKNKGRPASVLFTVARTRRAA